MSSDIFYTQVDSNLQQELDARGRAGRYSRTTADMNFMHGKIGNAVITAYEDANKTEVVGVIGGSEMRAGRFLPSSDVLLDPLTGNLEGGFLANYNYETETVIYTVTETGVRKADISSSYHYDSTNRIPPFLKDVSVEIGDHSMGLLNKATVSITVPNPGRDLDRIEKIWLRPGRYAKIEIHHPDDAVITGLLLTPYSLPNEDVIKQLHPEWKTEDLNQAKKINVHQFEGLITSFNFNYTLTGHVDITINMTGTSNVYTDISMYMASTDSQKTSKVKTANSEKIELATDARAENTGSNADTSTQFFDQLDYLVNNTLNVMQYNPLSNTDPVLTEFKIEGYDLSAYSDRYLLVGETYKPLVALPAVAETYTPSVALPASTNYQRYITLGSLVSVINHFILIKLKGTVQFTELICDDAICYSHYVENLVSCKPDEILLLPKNTASDYDMNTYGDLKYYQSFSDKSNKPWPGVYEKTSTGGGVMYPSRILINLKVIQSILDGISGKNTKNFTLKTLMASISSKIKYATGDSIDLKLVSFPNDLNKLLFTDTKYVKIKPVLEYSVPMFANHPNGTIVREFQFNAKLPDSAKNLAYVLNQANEATEQQIAPFINFMYSSDDVDKMNKLITKYRDSHIKYLNKLKETRIELGKHPANTQYQQGLHKAITDHIKYPTENIKKSQEMVAPIFPFDVEFTIDGINGLRYGDVLQFEALPLKYRANTVFSIIGIKHTISTSGIWTTNIRCIMRPKIG
jgi:hypothetical protein